MGILDFGFWGFWILDFGAWGFWILDFVTNFGFYIRRRRLCTPPRVGGYLQVGSMQKLGCCMVLEDILFSFVHVLCAEKLAIKL